MKFIINNHYTNQNIIDNFGGNPMVGMRYHKDNAGNEHMVLISKVSNNSYSDKISGNYLRYVGMGKNGNQKMSRGNKHLSDSLKDHFPVYLFFKISPKPYNSKHYVYAGLVKLIKKPDYILENGRYVYIFTLTTASNNNKSELTKFTKWLTNQHDKNLTKKIASHIKHEIFRNSKRQQHKSRSATYKASQRTTAQLKELVHKHEKQGSKAMNKKYYVSTSKYKRDPNVAELSKRFAKGRCQLCLLHHKSGITFIDKKSGEPYLESHHIKWLSHHGADSIKNVIALCPTCHRKMHLGKNTNKDAKLLKARALKLAKENGYD